MYPHRSAVPADTWRRFFERAECEIGILAYSGLFLAEDMAALNILRAKAHAGVRVRIALGDPDGRNVAQRGTDLRQDVRRRRWRDEPLGIEWIEKPFDSPVPCRLLRRAFGRGIHRQ